MPTRQCACFTTSSSRRRNEMNSALRIFLVAETILFFSTGMLGPIYAVFVEEIGGDILTAGASWSIFMILSGIGLIIAGRAVDKKGNEKPFIIVGYSLEALGFLGYVFVTTPLHLFAVQILLGISAAINYPSREAWFTKFLDKGKFGTQWATWEALYSITAGVASLVGAVIASIYGFKIMFISMFFIALCALVVVTKIPGARK